jgi:hypothetical protein
MRAHRTILDDVLSCSAPLGLALGDYHTQEVREGTLVSVFPSI